MDAILDKLNGTTLIDYHGRAIGVSCQQKSKKHPFSILDGTGPFDYSYTNLLLNMSLVLILSHFMRFILKPLRQPKVVSDVLAGIILGPSVLGHNQSFADNVTPPNLQFVIHNIGLMGFMYWLFVTGVKMDLTVITKAGKNHWVIAIAGVVVPHIVVWIVAILLREYMDQDLAKLSSIGGIVSALIITTFPVSYTILRDMHLLSSEIGRLALLTVIISDILGIAFIVTFEAFKQGDYKKINALYYVVALIILSNVVFVAVPLVMKWISRSTPEGEPVDQNYIMVVLLGVFVVAFSTDFIGAAIGNGPLWLGLAIPDGPPVGSTIVQKSETVMNHVLMPFAYATIGLLTDVYTMPQCWTCLTPLFGITIMAIFSKFVTVVVAARFTDMSYRDSVVLALILSLRGQVEFILYLHWVDLRMIRTPSFSMMVILTVIWTSITTPLISILYDPTRPYMTNKKRTIQHTMQESELRILACAYDQESIATLFSLLDISNPTTTNPFTVFALYLVELLGRAAPVFIDHSSQDEHWDSNNEAIHNAINQYQEARPDQVKMNFFTSVTPQRTMYQDICEIALLNKVSFIILPFHKKCLEGGTTETAAIIRPGVQSVNANTFSHAPCSVGIFACKDASTWARVPGRASHRLRRQIAMLFLGGPDAREGLTLADRMVGNPDVSLIVIRFLSSDYRGDNESERKLDDGLVTWFWVKNERNERVLYKEVVVSTGLETVSAIQSLNDTTTIDLWIVGRRNDASNPTLLEGMSDWNENPELGLIGDFLVSMDFSTTSSVLVVQQQVLRDQRASPWICIDI